jgi:coenzyme F420-reducing hydrogenase alpha subunit
LSAEGQHPGRSGLETSGFRQEWPANLLLLLGLKIVIGGIGSQLSHKITEKMKKKTPPATEPHKGFMELAGEALHVLGEEIVEKKDKVVESAAGKFSQLKKAVSKITHKKKSAPAKRVAKKAVKKVAKKVPKKSGVKKPRRK